MEQLDPRALTVEALARDGTPVDEETYLVHIEPVRLESGSALFYQAPFPTSLYLLKAQRLRDQAEPKRRAALTDTVTTADGSLRPRQTKAAFDAMEDLAISVILSTAAIETYANEAIRRLPDDAMVEIPTKVAGERIAVMRSKPAMEWLRLADKVDRVVPILTGRETIKGTTHWAAFRRLQRFRNAFVHVQRGVHNDPEKPSYFGRLLLGECSRAPEEAGAVIEALEPGWLRPQVREQLGL